MLTSTGNDDLLLLQVDIIILHPRDALESFCHGGYAGLAGHVHSEFGLQFNNYAITSIEMDTLALMTGQR
jgi:hypothetical protein